MASKRKGRVTEAAVTKPKWRIGTLGGIMITLSLLVSGAALATFTIGSFTNTFNQSAATLAPAGAPTGVTLTDSIATIAAQALGGSLSGDCASTNLGTAGSPTSLTTSIYNIECLNAPNTIAAGDFVWEALVTMSTSTATSTTFAIQEAIGTTTFTAFVKTPATISATTYVEMDYDLTYASVTSVSLVNVQVTQCSGSTCQ